MPQNNVLPDWRATYPNDAPVQKPGGVTVSTTATAPRVPNKPTYAAGTIQSFETFMEDVAEWDRKQAEARGEQEPEDTTEEENVDTEGVADEDENEDENGEEDEEGAPHHRGRSRPKHK